MGSFSIFHWLLVLVVILILFGAGRLPSVMGDLAKGIKAFRSGLKDDGDKPVDGAVPVVPATPAAVAPATSQETAPQAAVSHQAPVPSPVATVHVAESQSPSHSAAPMRPPGA
jgi:sec-independent protein translocase protein TatA